MQKKMVGNWLLPAAGEVLTAAFAVLCKAPVLSLKSISLPVDHVISPFPWKTGFAHSACTWCRLKLVFRDKAFARVLVAVMMKVKCGSPY